MGRRRPLSSRLLLSLALVPVAMIAAPASATAASGLGTTVSDPTRTSAVSIAESGQKGPVNGTLTDGLSNPRCGFYFAPR